MAPPTPTLMITAVVTTLMLLATPSQATYNLLANQTVRLPKYPMCLTCWNKTGGCNLTIPTNKSTHFCMPAKQCYCNHGMILCDGILPDADMKPWSAKCLRIRGAFCTNLFSNCDCHHCEPTNYMWWLIVGAIALLIWTGILLKCCVTGNVTRRPRRFCKWNWYLLLVLFLQNKFKTAQAENSIWPGECDKGICLRKVFYEGQCHPIGHSVKDPQFQPDSEAWCAHHDCCETAAHKYDVYHCSNGQYGWNDGCGWRGLGCYSCGVRIYGQRVPIYQMTGKRKCEVNNGGKIVVVSCPANDKVLRFSPDLQCYTNRPHNLKGVWDLKGDFHCDCPDPWHCSLSGGVALDGICTQSTRVEVKGAQCRVHAYEAVPTLAVQCKSTNPDFPCVKDGLVCFNTDCKVNHTEPTSEIVPYVQHFTGTLDPSIWFRGWFPDFPTILLLLLLLLAIYWLFFR
uniref:Uncharacterized protein n=1 Tax=Beihai mudskipper astro-like virus TaxID=2116128 RepID=A0A2P1GMA1_9VIRU|nr:hypothetical protein [Beihai mudskipper astro-like virus]